LASENYSTDGAGIEATRNEYIRDSPPKKTGWLTGITKTIASKVVTTKFGKKLLKDWVSPDGIEFILILRKILAKYIGSDSEAEFFEQIALQTFCDVVVLITNKNISKEKLLIVRDPMFQLWSDALDMLEISFLFDDERLHTAMHSVINIVTSIVMIEIEEEKREAMIKYSSIFGNKELIIEFYTLDKWKDERKELKDVLRRVWDSTFSTTLAGQR